MKIKKVDKIAEAARKLTDAVEIHGISVHHTVEALEKDGWNQDGFHLDWFKWDYWFNLKKEDKSIKLSGSGYYGTFITMSND